MNTTAKNVLLWMVILVVILLLFQVVNWGRTRDDGQLHRLHGDGRPRGEIDKVIIRGAEIRAFKKGTAEARAQHPHLRPALQRARQRPPRRT